MCLLMKYNSMGINNIHLKIVSQRETQEILWLFSRIATYRTQQLGYILYVFRPLKI